MDRRPDATRDISISLTTRELGRAFANRGDDEQVEILCAAVAAFDNYPQAELQACYIGKRLFSRASEREVENVLRFLAMIRYSCNADAQDVAKLTAADAAKAEG